MPRYDFPDGSWAIIPKNLEGWPKFPSDEFISEMQLFLFKQGIEADEATILKAFYTSIIGKDKIEEILKDRT